MSKMSHFVRCSRVGKCKDTKQIEAIRLSERSHQSSQTIVDNGQGRISTSMHDISTR